MRILLVLILIVIACPAWADKLEEQQPSLVAPQAPVSYVQYPAPATPKDATEQVLDILLSQGVAGVGLIVLGWWIKTSTAQARTDRLRIEERVFDLVEKSNTQLSEQHAELANISRELERIRG